MVSPNNAVRAELKNVLGRRREQLQKGEITFTATGQNTRRNANANKKHMNQLRRGSGSGPVLQKTNNIVKRPALEPYIKVSGLRAGVSALTCVSKGLGYTCTPRQKGGLRSKTRKVR
jgi:hypothetical protein